ncbi:aminopeptidase O-like isoform X2, partial [Biomphalaria glabrata]
LIPEQQVLFLDLLVEDSVTLSSNDFKELREIFQISTANPEVQHSWCELVISQHATRWLDDVRTFLIHHQVRTWLVMEYVFIVTVLKLASL